MILGLGIDLLENRRIERELARGGWRPEHGVFTAGEIRYCESGKHPALRYAACFAAKEATLKALGIGARDFGWWREVEVRPEAGIVLYARAKAESQQQGVRHIRLSIAHNARQTGAMVILEA